MNDSQKKAQKRYREKNKERLTKWRHEYNKQYRAKNKETLLERRKAFAEENRDQLAEKQRMNSRRNPHRAWAHSTRRNHLNKGFLCEISVDDLEAIAKSCPHCFLCGTALSWTQGEKGNRCTASSPTLDRLHDERVIKATNVKVVCHRCNTTKSARTLTEFIAYCTMISNKFKGL